MDLFNIFFSKLDIWVKSFNFLKAELGGSLDKFDRINFSKAAQGFFALLLIHELYSLLK